MKCEWCGADLLQRQGEPVCVNCGEKQPEPRKKSRFRAPAAMFLTQLSIAAAACWPGAGVAQSLEGRASVIDGDTIEIHGERIRLFGVDAVEGSQRCTLSDGREWRCGKDAAFALDGFLMGQTVRCVQRDTDRYGRIVARCYTPDGDVGAWLVDSGWAVAYAEYSGLYLGLEAEAREEGRGIWASEFVRPSEYRKLKPGRGS